MLRNQLEDNVNENNSQVVKASKFRLKINEHFID